MNCTSKTNSRDISGGYSRVKIVHRNVALGPDRVTHRTGILGELPRPQGVDVLDALDRVAVHHVPAEFLIAVHRQALLQRELPSKEI